MNQDSVVELHPEELQLSGDEESQEAGPDDQDKGLKIRRTVTQVSTRHVQPPPRKIRHSSSSFISHGVCQMLFQVVPSESHKNGQANEEEAMETTEDDSQHAASGDKRKDSVCEEAPEVQTSVKHDGDAEKGEQPR